MENKQDIITSANDDNVDNSAAVLLDGKATAAKIREEIREKVALRKEAGKSVPGLAVIIVGARKDSQTYVRGKRKACEEAGILSELYELPEDVTSAQVQERIESLNSRADIHGILLQLPLPKHLNEKYLISRIHYNKDVDGFHPLNSGALLQKPSSYTDIAIPCTPKGIIELLQRYDIEMAGKNACVIGRSNIVGLPIALLLLHRNATVTICHSRTPDIASKVRQADIVVAACGRPEYVRGDWLKPGAVVVDVGINAVDDPSKKKGYRLVGDVAAAEAHNVASFRTPVPGGVGPMTIAMLLENTLEACIRAEDK